jgi:N-acetylmuramoyl-L-alanine amidase
MTGDFAYQCCERSNRCKRSEDMPTGKDLITQAKKSLNDDYVYGADVDLKDPKWPGPWDCAEKATYDVFWVTGKIYGALDRDSDNPDPWTGAWASDVRKGIVISIPVKQAVKTPGAILLRYRQGGHHIVFSMGDGTTLGAQNSRDGVAYGPVGDVDSWDYGILIPGVDYGE